MRRIGSGDDEGRTLSTEKRRRKKGEGWRASTCSPVAFYEPPADSPARHTASLVRGNRQIAHPHSDPQYHFSLAPALLLLSLDRPSSTRRASGSGCCCCSESLHVLRTPLARQSCPRRARRGYHACLIERE